jgi:hypothetical protein
LPDRGGETVGTQGVVLRGLPLSRSTAPSAIASAARLSRCRRHAQGAGPGFRSRWEILATLQGTATGVPAITNMELSKPRVKLTSDLQSQALRAGHISPHEDTGAVIYDCDPQANRRAIVRVNELCKLRLWKGTREEAIEAAWRELDNAIRSWPSGSSGRRRIANKR